MKKIDWKNKAVLPIVLISIVLVAVMLVLIFSNITKKKDGDSKKSKSNEQTSVFFNNPYKDAKKITNKTLSKEHCLDDICVKNLTIYYTKESNNIELTLVNKGKKAATGYLKVVFGNKAMTVFYDSLKKESPYTIQLGKEELSETSDFTVRELTNEELAKIKKQERKA